MKCGKFVRTEFALANVCLVDKELNVGAHLILDDALELVVTDSRSYRSHVAEGRSGDNAVSHFNARKSVFLAALLHIESEEELAAEHFGRIFVCNRHSCCAAIFIRNNSVVATHFFALKGERSARSFF